MANSQKGATSTTCDQKKSPLDEDFGNDFLSSWPSAKMGKDAIDFDVETVPLIGKKSFNFDKLDDFELGSDFDKLSSFKMDMSDLDFSSPVNKTAKTTEKSSKELLLGKQESTKDKFSFSFDFNELDKFDLDSKLVKGEKKLSKCMDDIKPDCSIKLDKGIDSRCNSIMNSNGTKIIPNKKNMATSRPTHFTEPGILDNAKPSISNLLHYDVRPEAQTSTEKQTVIRENENETHIIQQHIEQSDGKWPIKPNAEKAPQDFALLSVSGDGSTHAKVHQTQAELVTSVSAKENIAREQESSMKSVDSSQSRNSSPANSYNSRCWMPKSKAESLDTSHKFQKHEGNQSEVSGASTSCSESNQDQKNVENPSVSQKHAPAIKNTGKKQDQRSNFLPSPSNRVSRLVQSMSTKEKGASALQLRSMNTTEGSLSQRTTASTPKHLHGLQNKKMEIMHLYPTSLKRESKPNDELAQNLEGGILKSDDISLKTSVPFLLESKRSNKDNDTSDFQLHPSNLHKQSTASNNAKSITSNLVSGYAPLKGFKNISFEGQDITPKDDKKCDISGSMTSRITKVNSRIPNSTMQKEIKSVRFLGGNLTPKVANTVITEKHALLSPSLKRKTLEEARADAETLKPLKRIMDSSTERRKPSDASPKLDSEAPETQKLEAPHSSVSVDNRTSPNGAPKAGSMMDFEVHVLIESDGNVEKAESCAKELDGICNMLKKKHEEAKELLVLAIVNNNALLMLNHPKFEEKISFHI
ncbi:uncharacterized protein At4g18490 isoform X2 [Phoenix dactylifera]|uniref:Uncharacterized protein At4g18490 isoform X2 n=1 Tax=Phoenix dactylifera TaxID=42345 RepID=A0A8B9A494_PHODC|nr:uncharacterized protein At4g18490 isoform X2 [Phoenix dactylifera]